MKEIVRKYILKNDFPVHKPQAVCLKIKRCQKVPACSLSTNSDMFKQPNNLEKTNRGRPRGPK
jgi:hypothetical protein